MLYSSFFLMTLPFVLCAPIQQQWSVNNQQQRVHTSGDQVSLSTMNMMIHDDIQGYYENIVDEIVSTHSEDVLVQMAHSMSDQQSLERLLQPQAIALLHHSVQETCLTRMPGMIAKHLHRLHTKVLDTIEPTLNNLLQTHQMMITEKHALNDDNEDDNEEGDDHPQYKKMMSRLTLLNSDMTQHVIQLLNQERLEHKVALDLSACEIQQNQLLLATPSSSSSIRPRTNSVWLLFRDFWKKAAEAASNSRPGRMMAELKENDTVVELDRLVTVVQDEAASTIVIPGPSLLRSHLNLLADSLQLEFEARLMDLYNTLRSDVFDEDFVQ